MAPPSTNRVRIVTNYVRLVSSFTLGLILVRLLLVMGEQAYGLIALLGAGTGIASAIKEVVRASTVPELGAAYHSGSRDRLRETYNTALVMSPVAAALTLIGFGLLAVSIRWIQIPEELVSVARGFLIAKALQTFFTICLAPTFNMYLVTERMVAYNFWVVAERLAEVAAVACVVLTCGSRGVGFQIVAYGALSAGLTIICSILSSTLLMRDEAELRPRLGSASVAALKSLLHSVGWNAVVVLAMNLYTRMDMFIVNFVFGLFGNLVFGIASQLTSYVRQLTMGIVAGVDAVAARLSSGDDQLAFQRLLRQSTRLQAMLVLPATFAMLFLAKPLIAVWLGSRISDPETTLPIVATLVRILIVGIAARSLSEGWMRILAGAGQVRLFAPTVLLTALLNPIAVCALIFLFRAEYKLFAPAVVFSCLLFVVHLVYLPIVVSRHCDLRLGEVLTPLKRPLFATLVSVSSLIAATQLPMDGSTTLLVSSVAYCGVYAIACYAMVLEPEERLVISRLVNTFRKRNQAEQCKVPGANDTIPHTSHSSTNAGPSGLPKRDAA